MNVINRTITSNNTRPNHSILIGIAPLMWSKVSSLQFSYWLGQAGIVHIGLDQRVLTAVSEIREKIGIAVCFGGGGVRSAAFCCGVLWAIA